MISELRTFLKRVCPLGPGDTVVCALSGGPDSMALLWALYLLRESMDFRLAAAHFNHGLRGAESDRDEAFVRDFCRDYRIPLSVGRGPVAAGDRGLEAAAREARYAFLETCPGWIATAHTADDNAETVLLHLVRGAGLDGLGGIPPVRGRIIRPMLGVTRDQVTAFLETYHVPFVRDSTNDGDAFLRNRLRHGVMPLLAAENPRLAEKLSAMALSLRQDAQALERASEAVDETDVTALRAAEPAVRRRALRRLLRESGVAEPESAHIDLAEGLVFSANPSAQGNFPGGVLLCRRYDRLEAIAPPPPLPQRVLEIPGITELPEQGLQVTCTPAETLEQGSDMFTVCPVGTVVVRGRRAGDEITLPGGRKSLKKLFIDRKIPAVQRPCVAVLADSAGVLAVEGVGVNRARAAEALPAMRIQIKRIPPAGGL